MSAVLRKIDDPRDALDRARRYDLVAFAKANGLNEITADMPAMLIRRKLRAKGLTRIQVTAPPLGRPAVDPIADPVGSGPEIDAEADLERQYAAAAPRKAVAQMGINELRAECKRLGIKLTRKDGMITMRAKIEENGK